MIYVTTQIVIFKYDYLETFFIVKLTELVAVYVKGPQPLSQRSSQVTRTVLTA